MTTFIGLTGGIGSGKSTVARLFSNHGIPILDLDQVAKDLIQDDKMLLDELVQTFGVTILNPNKTLNRQILATIAFHDEESTAKLNKLMHPRIREAESLWRKKQTDHPLAVIEASVLIESGDTQRMDKLIVVLCPIAIREQRVLARGTHSVKQFKQIVMRQCSDEQRLAEADDVFENNTSLQTLEIQVAQFLTNFPAA